MPIHSPQAILLKADYLHTKFNCYFAVRDELRHERKNPPEYGGFLMWNRD